MRRVIVNAIKLVAERHGIKLVELRVLDDHVHCFVHVSARMSVSECVRFLKGGSSFGVRNYIKKMRRYKALWSRGYFYRSVGNVTAEVVENYIRNSQGKHPYWAQTTLT